MAIRYPATALLCVDSEDSAAYVKKTYPVPTDFQEAYFGFREDDTKSTELIINKQAPLLFGYMTRIALTEVNFNWNIPNVNDVNGNMTIALWDMEGFDTYEDIGLSGQLVGYRRININPAFYTLPQLMEAVKTALNSEAGSFDYVDPFSSWAALLDWDVSFSYLGAQGASCTIEMTSTGRNMQFQIVPSTATYNPLPFDVSGASILPAKEDDLTFMLGLTPSVPRIIPSTGGSSCPAYKEIMSGYASMQFTPYIDVVSRILTKNQLVADNDSSTASRRNKLARIYLTNEDITTRVISATYNLSGVLTASSDNALGTSPFSFRREFKYPKQIQWNNTENVDLLDLQVIDFRGRVLYQLDTRATNESVGGDDPDDIEFVCTNGNSTPFQFTMMATEV
jgi:hypothetical protein